MFTLKGEFTNFDAYSITITPARGLQILSPSRILLYYPGASFHITMSKLVNSPFKGDKKNFLGYMSPL